MLPHPLEESQYWLSLEYSQKLQYPDFVEYMARQDEPMREEGQAAVIEFHDNANPSVQSFSTSRALRLYLTESKIAKRIFVLEKLPRNHVQVLGASLKVPPSFFASHWATPGITMGDVLNRTPRHYDCDNQFVLTFPKLHQARIDSRDGDEGYPFYYMNSSIHRNVSPITIFGDLDGPLSSFERVSFWRICNGRSWDAILLVDPPLGNYVTWRNSPIPRKVNHDSSIKMVDRIMPGLQQRGSWYPRSTALGQNRNLDRVAGMESMFKDILLLYSLVEPEFLQTAKSYMGICTGIVLSAWTARLRVIEAQIIQEQYKMSIGDAVADTSVPNLLDKSWKKDWHPRDFARLVRAKTALVAIDSELYCNMDALGIWSEDCIIEKWEAEAWKSLRNVAQTLKARLDITLEAYMQAVSIRESITSNKQARQVGYLTSLATLFIPISFVAAIFSMGGEFSAEADHFWVYWVIAVPMVGIGCVFLFTNLGGRILDNISLKQEQSLV